MVSQMANPHHGDLEPVRGKESSIWATNLTKEPRNDKELVSTYLLEPHNLKEIKMKSPPPLFFSSWGSSSPKQIMGGQNEKEEAQIFIDIFRGGLGVSHP